MGRVTPGRIPAASEPDVEEMRRDPRSGDAVLRRISGFHRDGEGHWVADLCCGHTQHVRHDPPWQNRPWVLTEGGRARFLGETLECVACARR